MGTDPSEVTTGCCISPSRVLALCFKGKVSPHAMLILLLTAEMGSAPVILSELQVYFFVLIKSAGMEHRAALFIPTQP